jgi:citrate lyase beta subunit
MDAGADSICIDLEDAVPPGRKTVARIPAGRFLKELATLSPRSDEENQGPWVIVRVNDPGSTAGQRDARTLTDCPPPDAFMIPKVATAAGVWSARRLLGMRCPLIPIIETALGLDNAAQIGSSTPDVAALVFGGFDLSAELGADPGWEPLLFARSVVVHSAALSNVDAIDMPSLELGDMAVVRSEAVKARRLGFAGKTAVHPAQIPVIHEVFTPSPDDVRRARRIVEADRAAGGGPVAVKGKMVAGPLVEAARRMLERAGEHDGTRRKATE